MMETALRDVLLEKDSDATNRILSAGSILSSSLLLCSGAFGTGLLTLPYAIKEGGLIFSVFACAFSTLLSALANTFLGVSARFWGSKDYGALVEDVGAYGLATPVAFDFLVVIYLILSIVMYFVFLADFSEQLLALFNISLPRWILLVILALINWPTIQMEKIQMLRFLSVASTACLGFVSLIVFTKFCLRGDRDMDLDAEAPERIALLPSSTENMAKALSIMLFANVNQMVSVPIVAELQNPTPSRIMKFTLVSATICFVFYVVTAFSVALTFGTATQGDFLKNYPVHDVVMIICRFLLLMMLMVCIPLNFFPMLQSFGRLRNDSLERKSTRRNWSTILLVVITAISMTISNVADFVSLVSSFLGSYFALLMPVDFEGSYQLTNEMTTFGRSIYLVFTVQTPRLTIEPGFNTAM
eukprot:GEMP01043675.1.p1 GENE.GEMP01043675.1~~GEMP01043675.1.p1  ORF type:complete len:415 (+),score=54.84 GEMP01043675.1:129-1373(+)